MAATAAKKPAAQVLPEPVELTFRLNKETKGTWVFTEEEADDGSVVIGTEYVKKQYFNGFVPNENTVLTVTLQVDQLDSE
jgi:K+-transporting ATPase c subunit